MLRRRAKTVYRDPCLTASPRSLRQSLRPPRVSTTLKMTIVGNGQRFIKLKHSLMSVCHSERSAEDVQTARSKTKSLHGVELFLHGLV